MMSLRCYNKVILKGFLGKSPEVRLLPSGDSVANFSIATTIQSHTEWHKIVCYSKLAEYVVKRLGEGDFVYIEAQIRTREFKTAESDEKGYRPRKVLELIAEEIHLVSKKGIGHALEDDRKKNGLDPENSGKSEAVVDNEFSDSLDDYRLPKYI